MANAIPIQMAGRPAGFYGGEDALKPVSLKRPESVSSAVSVRCECGVKTFLTNGVVEAPCIGCGRVVRILKP